MPIRENARKRSRMVVRKNAENRSRMAVRKDAENQSHMVAGKDASGCDHMVARGNQGRWDLGENRDLPAVLENVENQVRRDHRAPLDRWGQEGNRVSRDQQDLLVVHKTAYLHHFRARN